MKLLPTTLLLVLSVILAQENPVSNVAVTNAADLIKKAKEAVKKSQEKSKAKKPDEEKKVPEAEKLEPAPSVSSESKGNSEEFENKAKNQKNSVESNSVQTQISDSTSDSNNASSTPSSNQPKELEIKLKDSDNDGFKPEELLGSKLNMTEFAEIQPYNDTFKFKGVDDEFDSVDLQTIKRPEFIASLVYKACESVINRIWDQGKCGSCWAVSTIEAARSSSCVRALRKNPNNFSLNLVKNFSAQDVLECSAGGGCAGGSPKNAADRLTTVGAVQGGFFKSNEPFCKDYIFPPCYGGNMTLCNSVRIPSVLTCNKTCSSLPFQLAYNLDIKKCESYFSLLTEDDMKMMIVKNGAIVVGFQVFQNFMSTKNWSVYNTTSGTQLGGHAVTVVGWGVENGMPYWLVKNSWGIRWKDSGFFKIARGNMKLFGSYAITINC